MGMAEDLSIAGEFKNLFYLLHGPVFLFCVDLIHTCNYRYVFLYVYIDDVLEVKDWTQRDG